MRLLWIGDLADTGFGTVTKAVGPRLAKLGHDVRYLSDNTIGPDGKVRPFPEGFEDVAWGPEEGIPVLLGENDWKPEAAIMIGDYALTRRIVLRLAVDITEAFRKLPTYHYCPVEGVDLPRSWKELWDVVHPVAMSKFGQAEIAKVTGSLPPLAYHGVDTGTFYPVELGHQIAVGDVRIASKEAAKAFFGYRPDRTLILRTDRHMPRKRHNALLRALAPVLARNPNVDLALHCRIDDQGGDLRDQLSKYPSELASRVILTGGHDSFQGLPTEVLTALYNAADIYVSVSAEGFGLTIAEAIACGVPAVGIDYSAVPEVIGPAGAVVPIKGLMDNEFDHYWAAVDEVQFGQAVEYLVRHPAKRRELGHMGPLHVRRNFSWDACAQVFSDLVSTEAAVAA